MSNDALLPPSNFSDPTATYLNLSCLDLLMIELVPLAYRLANEIDATATTTMNTELEGRAIKRQNIHGGEGNLGIDGNLGVSRVKANSTIIAESKKMEEDEERDAVFFRLEALGYRVGQGLVESLK
ncbi:hypothetical protein HI914_00486 [Erysiphe necator]|uniref:Putative bet3 family protein n=1 Tax=Uncinula necator TaxID=52586 RepID=A0A0B1P8G3_UNCNE|nr:hypothetical protein HI914_00486 [Erysiphe necator]KHJ32944.1 putative bet3 family protein [Erysiphe necator]